MVYYGILKYIMVHYGILCYIMLYYSILHLDVDPRSPDLSFLAFLSLTWKRGKSSDLAKTISPEVPTENRPELLEVREGAGGHRSCIYCVYINTKIHMKYVCIYIYTDVEVSFNRELLAGAPI